MRALEVVDVAPEVKAALSMLEVPEGVVLEQFDIESAVEAFVFALGLRVVGTGMRNTDSNANEPDSQRGEARVGIASPGGTVVHGHAFG